MKEQKNSTKGIALMSVFLLSSVLAIMIVTVLLAVKNENTLTIGHTSRQQALYAAEAGLTTALSRLSQDASWEQDLLKQGLVGTDEANFTIVFDRDSDVKPWESVNNLNSNVATDGPRGKNTVPPFTADLVVVGQVNGIQKRIEVLLRKNALKIERPVSVDGKIRLAGNVIVDGITSLTDATPVEADVHSNVSEDSSDLIFWDAAMGDIAKIAGTVSISSPNSDSINFDDPDGTFSAKSVETDAGPKTTVYLDVASLVQGKSGATPATFSPFGSNTIGSGAPQDFHYSGDLVLNGDLVLDGATVYVDGNITVNGSVRGNGALYVNGDTSLRGSSSVTANNDAGVALLSEGNFELQGFDGSQYLNDLAAADPEVAAWYSQAKQALQQSQQDLNSKTINDLSEGGSVREQRVEIQRTLAPFGSGATFNGSDYGVLNKIADRITGSGPTEDFLRGKLQYLSDLYKGGGTHAGGDGVVLRHFVPDDPSTHLALLDAAADQRDEAAYEQSKAIITQFDINKLGQSYYQGLVYTNGYFRSSQDVKVVGAVVVHKGSAPPSGPNRPGDLILENGTEIIFNKKLSEGGGFGPGIIGVSAWMER